MPPLRRFSSTVLPLLLLGACAQLIGLSEYDTGEASAQGGAGGEGDQSTGGTSGAGVKTGGSGGDAGDGTAGVLSTGGRPGRGGAGGDSGAGGDPGGETGQGGAPTGGKGGKGGTSTGGSGVTGGDAGMAGSGTGGSAAGSGGSGGSGGAPVCTEITLPQYLAQVIDDLKLPYLALYALEIDPELGTAFPDALQLEFWDGGGFDGGELGTFSLGPDGEDDNYAFCSRCIVAYQDQDTTRERILFQTDGEITLLPTSQHMAGYANLQLSDVTLREVTIDDDGYSTVVPNGVCAHLQSGSLVIPPPDAWTCDVDWYTDSDCDCGCGMVDPTCANGTDAACDFCWCDSMSACPAGEVNASSNWLCL